MTRIMEIYQIGGCEIPKMGLGYDIFEFNTIY